MDAYRSTPSRPRRWSFRTLLALCALVLTLGLASGCMGDDGNDDAAANTPAVTQQTSNPGGTGNTTNATATGDTDVTPNVADSIAEVDAPTSLADLVEQVNPAVVTVINQQKFNGMFPQQGTGEEQIAGTGTGFIISADGYILTNNHVVEGSDTVSVILEDGTEVPAELIGTDPLTDLAVLKIEGTMPGVATLGDSEAMRPGDGVFAIGSPLGDYTNTVTQGIVSGIGRRLTGSNSVVDNMIQHDAAINPGNSGGPLFNFAGEVIGINTAVIRSSSSGIDAEGMGFAIPSNTAREVADALIADGNIERPFLGITYQQLNARSAATLNLPMDNGVVVVEVPTGPSADAGVQVDDVITEINGDAITTDTTLVDLLFEYQPGDVVSISIYRPSTEETLTLDVTLGSRPDNT